MRDLTHSNQLAINMDGFTYGVDRRTDRFRKVAVVNAPEGVFFNYWSGDGYAKPAPDDLHITPGYHPLLHGKTSARMVNGYTNAVVRGGFVQSIYCPDDVRSPLGKSGMDSWSYVQHPYWLKSSQLIMAVDLGKMDNPQAQVEFQEILAAALGVGDTFLEINGGFNAPLPYPSNVYPDKTTKARGSEHKCVWEYRTLMEEGELENAFVPQWFVREDWMSIYQDIQLDFAASF